MLKFATLFVLLPLGSWAQSCAITAPAALATISGTRYDITGTITSFAAAHSVEVVVDGDPQRPILWLTSGATVFTYPWNTNLRRNGPAHLISAVVRDAFGANPVTCPTVTFAVSNTPTYSGAETPAYINLDSVSGVPGGNWTGDVPLTAHISGTNASNGKTITVLVDGDYRNYTQSGQATTTPITTVHTVRHPNGQHQVCLEVHDNGGPLGDYGFGEQCWMATFANSNAPSEIIVGPKEWVISPGGTIQLTCTVRNADGSSGGSCSSPAWNTVDYQNNSISNPCSVNSSGLVTAAASVTSTTTCTVTVAVSGLTNYNVWGYVLSSNVIPHFGADGQIHTTCTGLSDCGYFISSFNTNPLQEFNDPTRTQAQFGIPYTAAGFNTMDYSLGPGTADCTSSESGFASGLSAYVSGIVNALRPWNLYWHAISTGLWTQTYPYYCIRGNSYATPPWQRFGAALQGSGINIGVDGPDESENDYRDPMPSAAISSSGPFTSITCPGGGSTTWSINYTWFPYTGPGTFVIRGATTNSQLNTTPGGALYRENFVSNNQATFSGPSCSSTVTVNSTSDPGLAIEPFAGAGASWYNSTDYIHYQDFATAISQMRTANPHPMNSGEVSQGGCSYCAYQWMSNPNFADYAVLLSATGGAWNAAPQWSSITAQTNFLDSSTETWPQFHKVYGWLQKSEATISVAGASFAYYRVDGTPLTNGIASINGKIVTFATPHGIYNVIPNCMTRVTISGSSNSYFNTNWCIDSCPTALTCTISRTAPSGSPANGTGGTMTFSDGSSATLTSIGNANAGTGQSMTFDSSTACKKRGETFTLSGTIGDSYWTSNTFYYVNFLDWTTPLMCGITSSRDYWREVPPNSQASGTASAVLYPDNWYHMGVDYNQAQSQGDPAASFAQAILGAMAGSGMMRNYALAPDYSYAPAGTNVSFGGNNLIESRNSPVNQNADADDLTAFNAFASSNRLLLRMATAGYLYQPRCNAPGYGFTIETAMRCGSKGNLLMTLNVLNQPATRAIDISGCVVNGQPTIRYVVDWRSINISSIAAGTTTDTPTWPAGGAIFYLCSTNAMAEYQPPAFSVRLADIPNATTVVIRYSHLPFMLDQSTANVVNLGSGAGTVAWDGKLGTLYYRLTYLDSNGQVLATGDVQTL